MGKTASGKDTILNEIVKLGYCKLVTYTTRPIRPGEVNGINYHFISTDDFQIKNKNGFFAETTSYKVASGETWYYGSAIKDYDKDSVMIVNPDGIKKIRKINSLNPIVFYIQADEDVIKERLRKRGDNPKEAERRIEADKKDFFCVEKYADYNIKNNGNGEYPPKMLARNIIGKYERKLR